MTAHKHAVMIKAKADNMELVVFSEHHVTGKWAEVLTDHLPAFQDFKEYFFAHPKHEKECLHWLNGGEVVASKGLISTTNPSKVWSPGSIFMDDRATIIIKPRKEKRWIGVTKSGESTMHYKDKRTLIENIERMGPLLDTYQLIQIEIEVK